MKILRADALPGGAPDLDEFFEAARRAPERILLLDYDGTLAPFRVERNEAVPYPGVREIVSEIARAQGSRVEIISGRAARELVPLLGVSPPPEIWGSHGRERLSPDGTLREAGEISSAAREALAAGRAWAERERLADRCEVKTGCLAFHWRGLAADEIAALSGRVRAEWTPLASRAALEIHEFDGGLELRVPGRSKGSVVAGVLAEAMPGAAVAYLGDDLTDEDAFRELGSRGLSVLVRPELRPTAAALWIVPPEELIEFLARWRGACPGN